METEIKHKVVNTSNENCYIVTKDGIKRSLMTLNKKYGFVSTTKVLEKAIHISPIGKPTKYFNEFNGLDQKEIESWMSS